MSYMELLPELGERQLLVFEEIRRKPLLTAKELQHNLHFLDANSVRPRITELQNAGLVVSGGKRKCRVTGKTVMVWRVV